MLAASFSAIALLSPALQATAKKWVAQDFTDSQAPHSDWSEVLVYERNGVFRCLDAGDGAQAGAHLQMRECRGGAGQLWRWETPWPERAPGKDAQPNPPFRYRLKDTDLCLQFDLGDRERPAPVRS